MVDDLLYVSRVTQGKVTLQQQPMRIAEGLQQAVDACRQQVDKRRQRLAQGLITMSPSRSSRTCSCDSLGVPSRL